jgi:ketosteroid isomerase-like protein
MPMKPAPSANYATPDEAEHAFYEALEHADLALLMGVWAEDEEIACIHPGGTRLVGHDAVKQAWAEILGNGPVTIRPTRRHTLQSLMGAVHTLVEQVVVETRDGTQVVNCYTTNVFHKGATGWHMVLHHASQAPDDIDADEHDVPDMLH